MNLRRTNKSNSQSVGISNFPKYKEASWFLIVANEESDQLLCIKRVAFKRTTQKNLVVCLPEDFNESRHLKVFLMCDSYIGLDQEYTIDLIKVNQILTSKKSKQAAKGKKQGDQSVVIQTGPPKSKVSSESASLDQTIDSGSKQGQEEMPQTFQLYSELSQKVFGTDRQQLIASDGDGREEEGSDSSFEFDVTADDIYDLTFF